MKHYGSWSWNPRSRNIKNTNHQHQLHLCRFILGDVNLRHTVQDLCQPRNFLMGLRCLGQAALCSWDPSNRRSPICSKMSCASRNHFSAWQIPSGLPCTTWPCLCPPHQVRPPTCTHLPQAARPRWILPLSCRSCFFTSCNSVRSCSFAASILRQILMFLTPAFSKAPCSWQRAE